MKKFITTILIAAVLTGLFSSCGTVKRPSFESNTDMQTYIGDAYWYCRTNDDKGRSHYKLCIFGATTRVLFDIYYDKDSTLSAAFEQMLITLYEENGSIPYGSVYDFLLEMPTIEGMYIGYEPIEYNNVNYQIREESGTIWEMTATDVLECSIGQFLATDSLTDLENAFSTALVRIYEQQEEQQLAAREAFLKNYPSTISSDDARYDPYGSLGKPFVLSGAAELNDYYNYEYRGMEAVYFCICITPEGGSFSDRWYIYAKRSACSDLFEYLKNNPNGKVTLICNTQYPNAAANGMASLADFHIG